MTAQAGWYPDPSGNTERLRFWDGGQWTNDFMDAAAVMQQVSAAAQYQAQVQQAQQMQAQGQQYVQQVQAQGQQYVQQVQNQQAYGQQVPSQQAQEVVETDFSIQTEQDSIPMGQIISETPLAQEEHMVEAGFAVQAEQGIQTDQIAQTEQVQAAQIAAEQVIQEEVDAQAVLAESIDVPDQSGVQPIEKSPNAQGIVPQSVQEPIAPAQAVQEPLAQPLYGVQRANSGASQSYQSPNYGVPAAYVSDNYDGAYQVDSMDATLRLVAFIFYMFTLASVLATALFTFGFTLICLAWVIPMSVRCWSIYKGQRPNTIAFGVCTLLFVNVIAGILLLISKKDN